MPTRGNPGQEMPASAQSATHGATEIAVDIWCSSSAASRTSLSAVAAARGVVAILPIAALGGVCRSSIERDGTVTRRLIDRKFTGKAILHVI
jgi:hypothetical protein